MTNAQDGVRRIGEYTEGHLLKHVQKLVDEKSKTTPIFSQEAEDRIPKFDASELDIGKVLGRGGFCVVNEIQNIKLHDEQHDETTTPISKTTMLETHDEADHPQSTIVQNRAFMQQYCIRQGNNARYAVKQLSKDTLKDSDLFVKGLVDLLIEAKFLAVIRHPHIVKMRAIVNCTDITPRGDYFIVLDRLYETLPSKLIQWNKQANTVSARCCLGGKSNTSSSSNWVDRMWVAYDLASALNYLHSLNIVYRDLKPDNIRFDVRGDVKIFDFGLARELNSDLLSGDGLYQMTGDTGSILYMAPEVALQQPYNLKVDVYSFGILLWQLCKASTEVYEGFTYNMMLKAVVKGGARPTQDSTWSLLIKILMNACWSKEIGERPTMKAVLEELAKEINNCDDEGNARQRFLMEDISRKSIHSLQSEESKELVK